MYNTESSSYITLDNLVTWCAPGGDFVVYDAKSGDDITRSVLTQIIVEEEGKNGQNLLPTPFLRQLIGFYGGSMQTLVPKYLEHAMTSFAAAAGANANGDAEDDGQPASRLEISRKSGGRTSR